jgi:hypothetical protein
MVMATVIETFKSYTEHPGTSDQVVNKMVAMGWVVEEVDGIATRLSHSLIPGSTRVVIHT